MFFNLLLTALLSVFFLTQPLLTCQAAIAAWLEKK